MAIQTEAWLRTIEKNFWPADSFLSKAVIDDQYVNNKVVHIPNAGSASKVEMDRKTLPAEATQRSDSEVTYELHEFTTNPVFIQMTEEQQLSYEKRLSVIMEDKANLLNKMAGYILRQWAPATDKIIATTGSAVAAHLPGSSGKRASMTTDDMLSLMAAFNKEDIPQEGRYILLDAYMHQQLIKSMSSNEMAAYQACADLKNGVLGKFASFNVMMRSEVLAYSTEGTLNSEGAKGAAGDNAGAIAWYERAVSCARNKVHMFVDEGNPGYYGDIYSFKVNAGGAKRRTDKKGVWVIRQASAE